MLLVEYRLLDKVKVINEGSGTTKKLKLRGVCQRMEEENNNGRIYPKQILESQVKKIQDKIQERSLVGALDHPPNDQIHLSQASHLVTKLWCEGNEVYGEFEILSTPNGKIVEALIKDNVKIGISSRGLGSVSESKGKKIVNEDFQLITFDLVSDPSTKGAYPELTESVKKESAKAQKIVDRVRREQIFEVALRSKLNESWNKKSYGFRRNADGTPAKPVKKNPRKDYEKGVGPAGKPSNIYSSDPKPKTKETPKFDESKNILFSKLAEMCKGKKKKART